MQYPTTIVLSSCLLAVTTIPVAADPVVNCGVRSLADAVEHAQGTNPVITFTGVCGPIEIRKDGVTLQGVGTAVIDGGGEEDAVTVTGASRVILTGFEVQHGLNGIVAANGAHLSLVDVNVHDNVASGISLGTASSAGLTDVTTSYNGHGQIGFVADNGSGVVLVNSEITGNTITHVTLTFGTRFDSGIMQFGTYACDDTVLVRGASGVVCPH